MPRYFIQGYLTIDPPSHPDVVMDALNRHGAALTSSSADRGGSHFRIGETVKARDPDTAITSLGQRIEAAAERRRRTDPVLRFVVGCLVAEFVSEWLADNEFGSPQLGPVRQLSHS